MTGNRVKSGISVGWLWVALVVAGLTLLPVAASAQGRALGTDRPAIAAAADTGGTTLAKQQCRRVCKQVRVPYTVYEKVCQWLNRTKVCRYLRRLRYRLEIKCSISCGGIRG